MNEHNEILFCEILPSLARKYENERFNDSLIISLRNLKFGRDDIGEIESEEIEIEFENWKCRTIFENRTMFQQSKISEDEEMMFGIFGIPKEEIDHDQSLNLAEEFGARIILPKISDHYSSSHIEIRDYDMKDPELVSKFAEVFSSDSEAIKIRQRSNTELYLHLNFKRDQQTTRSILFECIGLMFEILKGSSSEVVSIKNLQIPFVHYGNVRICMNLDKNEIANATIFNFYGTIFGYIESMESRNSSQIPSKIFSILKNRMNLLKSFENYSELMDSNLAYLGIDSLRIVELEYYIGELFHGIKSKHGNSFLMRFRTFREIVQFLEGFQQDSGTQFISDALGKCDVRKSGTLTDSPETFQIPMSSQQKRILFTMEFEKSESSQFDEQIRVRIEPFDGKKLLESINFLIIRHSILRTIYSEASQYLLSATETFISIRSADASENDDHFVTLKLFLEDENILSIILNHIAIDGRSLANFYTQFRDLYFFQIRDLPIVQYHEYCRKSQTFSDQDEQFWRNYLEPSDSVPMDDFSSSKDRGISLKREFPKKLQEKFEKLCNQFSCTNFEMFLSLFQVLITKIFGIVNFNIGYAVDIRSAEFKDSLGCFTNLLPFRNIFPCENFIKETQRNLENARKHWNYPYEKIKRLAGENPFQILLVSDIVERSVNEVNRKKVRFSSEFEILESNNVKSPKFVMTWYFRKALDLNNFSVEVEYSENRFENSTIQFLIDFLFRIINQFPKLENLAKPRNPIIKVDYPRKTISQIICNPRCSFSNSDYSIDPSSVSKSLFKYFLTHFGQISSDIPVILKMNRDHKLIETVLAVWKCGFFPIPIHQQTTEFGITKIRKQIAPKSLLISDSTINTIFQGAIWNRTTVYDMAYVTCTSGSTGEPKLVGTSFEGHSNLAINYTTMLKISEKDTVCQIVDPSFDIFFADITKCFVNDARLLLCRDSLCTPAELSESTNAYLMPAFLSRVPEIEKVLRNLETLQFGGEPLASRTLQTIWESYKDLRIWQEFGLTEQTVYSAAIRMRHEQQVRRIGTPYNNIRLSVVDESGNSVPEICKSGFLMVGGCGLMRGYFGTRESIGRDFATGDEVRTNLDGSIEFVGRKDSQIKISGHRIDLCEIESISQNSGLILSSCCIPTPDRKSLILFYKPKESHFSESGLKIFLEEELPFYKVPSQLHLLSEFPLTRTGKIDKRKLLEMVKTSGNSGDVSRNPINSSISDLLKKWLEQYSESEIPTIDHDIFSCGVDSISLMLASQKLRSYGINMNLKKMFQLKTLRRITESVEYQRIEDPQEPESSHFPTSKQDHHINLNHIQQRILFITRYLNCSDLFRIRLHFPIHHHSSSQLLNSINQIVQGNSLLRAKIQRINGEHRFVIHSATETFHCLLERSDDSEQSLLEIWREDQLEISIHHLICDGRSLQILKKQIESLLNGEKIIFERNFDIEDTELPHNSTYTFNSIFPDFPGISTPNRKIIEIPSKPTASKFIFSILQCISDVFHLTQKFPFALTLANRRESNWNTISMFANTLPIMFDPLLDTEDKISDRIEEFSKLYSNIPLKSIASKIGHIADFAFNFQSGTSDIEASQFPILLTLTENSIIMDHDPKSVSSTQIHHLQELLTRVFEAKKHNVEDKVRKVFHKFIDAKITDDSNFFHLGGHSLTAMKLIDQLSEDLGREIPIRLIFDNPTIKKLTMVLESDQVKEKKINSKKSSRIFQIPLSSQQSQMFYLSQLSGNSTEYQLPFIQPFPKSVDVKAIHRALLITIQHQSIYRTIFGISRDNGIAYQQVVSMTESYIPCLVDIVQNESELVGRIKDLCEEEIAILDGCSVVRASFIESPERCVAFLHLHHIISDARSTQITNNSMRSLVNDASMQFHRSQYSYFDYCTEMRNEIGGFDKGYLNQIVRGVREASPVMNCGFRCSIDIPKSSVVVKDSSPFSIFLDSTSRILMRRLKKESINIVFPILNRNEKTSNICGYFLNNLVINCPANNSDISEIIQKNYGYSELIQEIRKISKIENLEIGEVYLNCRYDLEYDETDDEQLLNLVPLKIHFPIEIDVDLLMDLYRITIRSNQFEKYELDAILKEIKSNIIDNSGVIQETNSITHGPRRDITSHSYPQLLHQFFTSIPQTPFCIEIDENLARRTTSYSEAWQKIEQTSKSLQKSFAINRGSLIRSDDLIAIVASKSASTTLKCLAVQLAGAAYLPVDQEYPENRINQILSNSIAIIPEVCEAPLKTRIFNKASSYDLGYCITTSGTTGSPKSVCICGKSISNLCVSSTLSFSPNNDSGIYQFTNFVFDNSVLEICMTISSQARLIYDKIALLDSTRFQNLLSIPGFTHSLLFPSLVQSIPLLKIASLAYWIVGGERLPQSLLDAALSIGIRVLQNYGPTETTAFAIWRRMRRGDRANCIGTPAINTMVMVDGGQLLIDGFGKMRGYLRSLEGFKKIGNSNWYISGDICKIEMGLVRFEGRADSQIKIRGFRVDLSEIEKCIESNLSIVRCKTIFKKETQQIIAFYVSNSNISGNELREYCTKSLEKHKIPSKFEKVTEFPLTNNSKIDMKSLVEGTIESRLSSIWKQLLSTSPNHNAHFFLIGGHSLLLIRLRHLIEQEFQIKISVSEMLNTLKFGDQVHFIREKTKKPRSLVFVIFPALYGGCTTYLKLARRLKEIGEVRYLEEEYGKTVEEVAVKYNSQIKLLHEKNHKLVFIGASAAGTFAYATSQLFIAKNQEIDLIMIDAGTFWKEIGKLNYEEHEMQISKNLEIFGADQQSIIEICKSSWNSLQVLKMYSPREIRKTQRILVLSIDNTDLGWKRYSTNVEVFQISGNHYNMLLDDTHVDSISKIVYINIK